MAESPSAVILEPKKIVSHCVHCFPIYLPCSDGTRCHDLSFLSVEFWANISLSSFIKRLFSSSLSSISVVSSAYLRLLIFLPAILIPAVLHPAWHFTLCTLYICYISRLTIYSLDILLSQWNQSIVPCPFHVYVIQATEVTVASWPAYWFLRRQVRCSGIPISLRIFQFVVIYTVKGFGAINKAESEWKWSCSVMSNSLRHHGL